METALKTREHLIEELTDLRRTVSPFNTLFDSPLIGIIVFDEQGILFVNTGAEIITGYSSAELCTLALEDIIHPLFRDQVSNFENLRLQGEMSPSHYEFKILCKSQNECWIDYIASHTHFEGHSIIIGIAKDISESKQAEKAVRESEQRYRITLHSISDPVMIINAQGIIETVNDAAVTTYNSSSHSIMVGIHLSNLFPSSFAQTRWDAIKKTISEKIGTQIEETLQLGDSAIWLSTTINPLLNLDGTCSKAVVVSHDFTTEKENQQYLRFFSRNVLLSQENERKRISRELHDGLAQSMVALRLDLRFIENNLAPNQTELQKKSHQAVSAITSMLDETRRIAMDLSPAILEDIGLTSAVRKLIADFSQRYAVRTTVDVIDLNGFFHPSEEIHIYRILQEVFANIAHHSHARNVSLFVNNIENFIEFRLRDDGIGFKSEIIPASQTATLHIGLRDLQERARLLNGSLEIHSTPGEGTLLILLLPKIHQSLPVEKN